MGGMGFGAWVAAKFVHRLPNLLLGNRDKDGIIYESNAMLQEDFNLSAPQKVYILSAFIMSALAADKNEIALEQWAQYKDEAFPDQRAWPFVLDLLLNMARNPL